ncbi:glycosyltransferase [uncultured Microscilla sp.]|uniref:glycosyltransferase n=1 Tax=uncultured Microscilla sp. TaxID=432653 RepID=UPI00261C2B08|nr:glycosyltransferase [uncultured Microscilla sp.]
MKKRVALVAFGISSLAGGGGAERQFTDTYEYYQKKTDRKFDLYYILDPQSYEALTQLGILHFKENVILLKKHSFIPRKFRSFFWSIEFIFKAKKRGIHLVHAYLPSITYGLSILFSRLIPKRPLITVNINDCTLAHAYTSAYTFDSAGNTKKTIFLYRNFSFDGYFSWYTLFTEVAQKHNVVKGNPIIKSAKYCFANQIYKPGNKQNLIVYAGRLVEQKDPIFFIQAILHLYKQYPEVTKEWKVKMFGKGPLYNALTDFIEQNNLQQIVEVTSTDNMLEVFSKSKLFISSQLYENFTSLSMLEAMSAGNAIIARNVGQTDYFVKDGQNGYLLTKDTPENMGDLIYQYTSQPKLQQEMQDRSLYIANEVHNVHNFLNDIEDFWNTFFLPEKPY